MCVQDGERIKDIENRNKELTTLKANKKRYRSHDEEDHDDHDPKLKRLVNAYLASNLYMYPPPPSLLHQNAKLHKAVVLTSKDIVLP